MIDLKLEEYKILYEIESVYFMLNSTDLTQKEKDIACVAFRDGYRYAIEKLGEKLVKEVEEL